jgi:hypothetical protein
MDGTVIPAAMTLGIADPFNMNDEELGRRRSATQAARVNRFY